MGRARPLNPDDIIVPSQYRIEVFAEGLTAPISLTFMDTGDMLVADAGITDGNGKVLKRTTNGFVVIAEGFDPPLTGINVYQGHIYVSHRGTITVVKPDGHKQDILSGLPSWGDHHNNQVVFGRDGKMYFGQGTATNSGVVGEDNRWVKKYPLFHDYPGMSIRLSGQNFITRNVLSQAAHDLAVTGAYSPFGVPTNPGEQVKEIVKASGSILRANPDGSDLQLVAWGLRNLFRIKFDRKNRLFAANHGMDERGSRPVANSPDEFHRIRFGVWYGWPDYTGGYPVTLPRFKPAGKPQPTFLLSEHPMLPPHPIAIFAPHSAIMGFDFNYDPNFGPVGEVFIAEFGSEAPGTTGGKPAPRVGHRVSRIDIKTGKVRNFAMNRSGYAASHTGSGGLERPIDVVFGPDGSMYVVDMGITVGFGNLIPNTGVIWRISRT
ncbi:NHL repeat containing protein (plasmid) [Alicyclobacillus acidocaldarius subsp. acidocaldarius DSM 446]|uniref:NHL repeat containing protein n=1 Tax=Alicyclobacillus acidocaldarius subsp. acidocaldarius (strain ATCC 27009 / DSM 446 / BCRC 14685 / JCM 5260 / KCTC 1825 / NBRC 15652 / NCIMB 11725 / NRRL B-14509 / 104-IA) TaxID=521098 RepID=C8WYG7_ALIAD|nr:NHL repeat containing protein [Alicyclobacillus acidocaldarius subsp. acidocaldarius DSM 446]